MVSGGVIRIGSGLVFLEVARITSSAQGGVLATCMALDASSGRVCASERELGGAVVEGGRYPRRGVVAQRAILRESAGDMVRTLGGLKLAQVASATSGAEAFVYTA